MVVEALIAPGQTAVGKMAVFTSIFLCRRRPLDSGRWLILPANLLCHLHPLFRDFVNNTLVGTPGAYS